MQKILKIVMSLIFLLPQCKLGAREKKILTYSKEKNNIYKEYLVDYKSYKTKEGAFLHKKYIHHLIGIARVIKEEKKTLRTASAVSNFRGEKYVKTFKSKNLCSPSMGNFSL